MMTDQKMFIHRLQGPQEILLYWSAQIKEILKAKRVFHVGPADEAASSSPLRQVLVGDEGSDVASDLEYAMDLACSII